MPAERWVLEQPEQILRLHRDFVAAGADIILTCTFGGTGICLEHGGLAEHAGEINHKAAELARQAAGEDTLVAGSIGPTGQLLQPFGPLTEEWAVETFAAQAKALVEGGVDFLLVETQFDMNEAKAAIAGVRSVSTLPLVVSFSYDRGTRTMMGIKPALTAAEMEALKVDVIGINCGRSLDENLNALKELKAAVSLPVWFKPNAGLPRLDDQGTPIYDVAPEDMGRHACEWVAAGANVVGGCCGTSPEHLRQIVLAIKS
jgi:5-methyltetrahydrofolate--homocysteine methyltransferase